MDTFYDVIKRIFRSARRGNDYVLSSKEVDEMLTEIECEDDIRRAATREAEKHEEEALEGKHDVSEITSALGNNRMTTRPTARFCSTCRFAELPPLASMMRRSLIYAGQEGSLQIRCTKAAKKLKDSQDGLSHESAQAIRGALDWMRTTWVCEEWEAWDE